MTNNTFYYFFSTFALCMAAITGLAMVAIQLRISFLDNIITQKKRVIVSEWQGAAHVGAIEHMMASLSASEVVTEVKKRKITTSNIPALCENLKQELVKSQANRQTSARLLSALVALTILPIAEVLLSEHLGTASTLIKSLVIGANIIALLVVGVTVILTVNLVLDIRLKRNIDG